MRRRLLNCAALAAALACLTMLVVTPGAFADYGAGAQFQVELSANNVGGDTGHGLWLWIELNSDGTGDYTGSICVHTGSDGLNAATPLRGDVTWSDDGTNLTIRSIVLNLRDGRQLLLSITVPDMTGHYTGPSGDFIAPNVIGGDAQVEVAP